MPALHSRSDVNTRMFLFCSTLIIYIRRCEFLACQSLPHLFTFCPTIKTKLLEVSGIVR